MPSTGVNFKIKESIIAKIKLETGPAKDTSAESLLGFFKLIGLNGTGFPHPKPSSNKNMVPTGSKCAPGFRVILPIFLAVLSPKAFATNAWENSCTDIDIIKAPAKRKKTIGS